MIDKFEKRYRRHRRVRAKVKGTKERPRFSVFRCGRHIYGQLIDDEKGRTLISANDLELRPKIEDRRPKVKIKNKKIEKELSGKIRIAYQIGQLIAKKAMEKEIKKVVFDRGGYKYHGRLKAMAEGAREGGLEF